MALLAAWSGYASSKWSTDSRLELAKASGLRIDASREDAGTSELRNFDSTIFESWFSADVARNKTAMRLAERSFRPELQGRLRRLAGDEAGDERPQAPRGPTYKPQYKRPGLAEAKALDARAKATFVDGEKDGSTADKYVRLTVVLASILFLVGIQTPTSPTGASATA